MTAFADSMEQLKDQVQDLIDNVDDPTPESIEYDLDCAVNDLTAVYERLDEVLTTDLEDVCDFVQGVRGELDITIRELIELLRRI